MPPKTSSPVGSKPPRFLGPASWALYGALLALGAPAGLWLFLRALDPQSEEARMAAVYWFTGGATLTVLALFGVVAGRMMSKLREASTHDPLTGLANRRLLLGQLPNLIANHARHRDFLCLLMLDLDHFKRVNDAHGHAIGDKTLVAVAHTIEDVVRKGDVVARYGGEEFVVVCPDTAEEAGLAIAERIRKSVSSLTETALGFDGVQTISIGLVCTTPDHATPTLLLKYADEVLYEAKSSGRDRVCIYRGEERRPEDSSSRVQAT